MGMEMNQFGIWSIKIPDCDGNPAIPHNSGVKFRFKHGNGAWVDRIPACSKYATVKPGKFAAPCDGVYWDSPPSERVEETLEDSNHKKSASFSQTSTATLVENEQNIKELASADKSVSFSASSTTNGEENEEREFDSFRNSDVEFASSENSDVGSREAEGLKIKATRDELADD